MSQRICERLSADYLSPRKGWPGLGDLIDQGPKPGNDCGPEEVDDSRWKLPKKLTAGCGDRCAPLA
jgi:hypothetical protein